jgi:polyisoprenoid-binding protein YceI
MLVAAKAAPTPEKSATGAADFELEPTGSSLTFTAVQQSAKFESRFERFTALVRFDPAQPETGSITARIDLDSVDTGNPERDEVLKGADWFNLSRWPEAVFTAERIVRAGDGYAASGTLALRDVTRPVQLQFRWTPAAMNQPARLVGSVALERLAFGVGQGDWRDTAYVGNGVDVQVDIRLRPGQPTVKSVPITNKAPDVR